MALWNIPTLRYQYEQEVRSLQEQGTVMESNLSVDDPNISQEQIDKQIAIKLHAERRSLVVQYKGMTPDFLRKDIFSRNEKKYGDPYGPTIDYLRGQGKSWSEIRESASRPGGGDLWYNRASSYIGSWVDWIKKDLGYGTSNTNNNDL